MPPRSRPRPSVAATEHSIDAPALVTWFRNNARPLPWRKPGTTAWSVLVSEVMSQQTPVARVIPRWTAWLARWPTPCDLAAAPTAEVLTQWDRLGYPRRALRLKECATVLCRDFGGEVPDDLEVLLSLPGIGEYTARAVLAFHYHRRVPVVDTNVRRVFTRAVAGNYLPGPARRADLANVEQLLPELPESANCGCGAVSGAGTGSASTREIEERCAQLSVALMELGALVCTASSPDCLACPIAHTCHWQELGCPEPSDDELDQARKRVQKFAGTDRQVRGIIMALAREHGVVTEDQIKSAWPDQAQLSRALHSLLDDGLLSSADRPGAFQLPD